MIDYRVRAILITNNNTLLLIKREKTDTLPYWVFPGGGVEKQDGKDFKAALHRELIEELNADIKKIIKPVYCIKRDKGNQVTQYEIYYITEINSWSENNRTGPEFLNKSNGDYSIEEIPLEKNYLHKTSIKPDEVKAFISNHRKAIKSMPEINLDTAIKAL